MSSLEDTQFINDEAELETAIKNVRSSSIEEQLADFQQLIVDEAACIDRCARYLQTVESSKGGSL